MRGQHNFYIVKKNDTLSKIARENGTTVGELMKINGIKNPNKIELDQRIALRKEAACGVQALFLDKDRNPIEGLSYRLEYCNKSVNGKSGKDGKSQQIYTETPEDFVRIRIQRLNTTWKHVATIISDVGKKIVEIKGGHLMAEAKAEKHPESVDKKKPSTKEKPKPAHPQDSPPKPTTDKKKLGPEANSTKTSDGKPLTKIQGDIPDLNEFLDEFVGGEVTSDDITAAAKELKCDPGLIHAIARQESAHSSFFMLGKRKVPKILFERQWFRNLTRPNKSSPSPHEMTHPEICGRAYHRTKKKNGVLVDRKTEEVVALNDAYGPEGEFQYQRLVKAYQLDPDAALKACSWGKFQIMGFNHKAAGYPTVKDFTKAMSRSDAAHINAFLKFAKNNPLLLDGLRNADFEKIAEGHNGGSWKKVNPEYANNIEKFYAEYKKK